MDDLELELEMMTIDGIRVPKIDILYNVLITQRRSVLFVTSPSQWPLLLSGSVRVGDIATLAPGMASLPLAMNLLALKENSSLLVRC